MEHADQSGRLFSGASPAQVAEALAPLVSFSPAGMDLSELQALVAERLLPHLMRYDAPAFQSMFNAFPETGATAGAQLALAFNQGVTNWQVSPGGAVLEESCCRALCQLFGLAPDADATFMLSGTYANHEAVYLALHRYAEGCGFDLAASGLAGFEDPRRLAVLVSEDVHFSLKHAVRMLGLGEQSLVTIPVDSQRRLDPIALRETMRHLNGKREVFCLVATAGTTSTGAIDPIAEMALVSEAAGAWLHVDGAYGYAYKLVPEMEGRFSGDRLADSITWDPHKQLGVPIPNSVLFVRNWRDFGRMALHSGYFNRREEAVPNPGLKSPPSTRPLAALPLVMSLRLRGLRQVSDDLRAHLTAVSSLADYLHDLPEIRTCHAPDTGVLCFRIEPVGMKEGELERLQRRLYERVLAEGRRSISVTRLDGRTVLRLVVVSEKVSVTNLIETVDILRQMAGVRS